MSRLKPHKATVIGKGTGDFVRNFVILRNNNSSKCKFVKISHKACPFRDTLRWPNAKTSVKVKTLDSDIQTTCVKMLPSSVVHSRENCIQTGVNLNQEAPHERISARSEMLGLCHVCGDRASGRHYGVASCEGCKSFFKRSIRCDVKYSCRFNYQACPINVKTRSRCQYCRLQKCLRVGMRKEAVKQPAESSNHPPPLLLSRPPMSSYPYKAPVQHALPSHHLNALVRANWVARWRDPMNYVAVVNYPMKHERITIRILRYTVEWAKSLPFFTGLCQSDKQLMLEACWLELFLLAVTHYQLLPDLAKLLLLLKGRSVDKTVRQLELEVNKCRALNCDEIEMECLKAIVLCNADCPNLSDEPTIRRLQEEILISMEDYMRSRYSNRCIAHFGRTLLHLPRLRYVKFLVPQDFIFPEITEDPDFILTFIKDVLC